MPELLTLQATTTHEASARAATSDAATTIPLIAAEINDLNAITLATRTAGLVAVKVAVIVIAVVAATAITHARLIAVVIIVTAATIIIAAVIIAAAIIIIPITATAVSVIIDKASKPIKRLNSKKNIRITL